MTTKSAKTETYERAAALAARLMPALATAQPQLDLHIHAGWVAQRAVELLRLADRLHRYAEAACNYQLSEAQEKRVARYEERVRALCRELGVGVTFNGDPRGFAVKLHLPSGDYNTWGGKEHGWGI